MKDTQLLKGVLDGCILAVISQGEIYGYELLKKLKEDSFPNIVGGTMYPILQKLEKKSYIKGIVKRSPDGPDRRYFSITSEGTKFLIDFENQWTELVIKVDAILEETHGK